MCFGRVLVAPAAIDYRAPPGWNGAALFAYASKSDISVPCFHDRFSSGE